MRRRRGFIGQNFRTRWARLFDESGWLNPNLAAAMREARKTVPEQSDNPDTRLRALPRPLHSDWVWRPGAWSELVGAECRTAGAELVGGTKLFHDGPGASCGAVQYALDGGASGVAIETEGFTGSFVSLAIDVPKAGLEGLSARHLVCVSIDVEGEATGRVFVRMNLKVGPNVVQFQSELGDRGSVEFDLVDSALAEAAPNAGWLDVIVEAPVARRLEIRDLTVWRRPRADM